MRLQWVDYGWIFLYFAALGFIAILTARRRRGGADEVEDFLLAGRSLTLPLFVATLVATWYGAILGVGEFVYNAGIAEWFAFALPYYIVALLYASVMAVPIRQQPARTIPEQLRRYYGNTAALIGAVLIVVLTLPVSYALSFGLLISVFADLPRWVAIVIGTLFSMGYLVTGGFRAGVWTDVVQFLLMYTGFILLTIFTFDHFGSPAAMWQLLPETHTHLPGPYSWQFLLVWYIIALQTFVDPGFHQRCAAVRRPEIARKGIRIAVVFWFLFDLMTLSCGLYARAYFPNLSDPLLSYPVLADTVLPVALKGFFIVALLATIMSTLDSYGFISAMTLSYDILPAVLRKLRWQISEVALTRVALGVIAAFCVAFAVLLPSIVQLIYYSASIAVSGLLLPLLLSYVPERSISPNAAKRVMLMGSLTAAVWIGLQKSMGENVPIVHDIEPMLVGLSAAVCTLGYQWLWSQWKG